MSSSLQINLKHLVETEEGDRVLICNNLSHKPYHIQIESYLIISRDSCKRIAIFDAAQPRAAAYLIPFM